MTQTPAKSARIEARITPDVLATVRRAAEIQGRSVSDFLVAAAREAAERTIHDTQIIRMSLRDQERVADLLTTGPAPSPGLERALAAHSRIIRQAE